LGVEADGLVKVLNGLLKLAQVSVGGAPVAVGQGKLGVEADGLVKVLDGPLMLAQVTVGEAPVVVGVGILGVESAVNSAAPPQPVRTAPTDKTSTRRRTMPRSTVRLPQRGLYYYNK